jgi:S1-C subfamily serine protease
MHDVLSCAVRRLIIGAVMLSPLWQGPRACRVANAADDGPTATADTPFQTEDISIGEPISLPSAPPLAPPTSPAPQAAPLPAASPAAPAGAAAPGSGWLGLAVDDTVVTGRLVVVEVAADGPADRAGVRPQDMLLAINGVQLRNGDELAAALAAIGPGQRVKMAIGRDNRVEDVVAQATTRPSAAVSRDWRQAEPPATTAAPTTTPSPVVVAPSVLIPAPSVVIPPATAQPVVVASSSPAAAPLAMAPGLPPASLLPTAPAAEPLPPPRSIPAVPATTGRTALGVRTVPVDAGMQSRFNLSDARGAFVIGVVQDLPAAKAGVPPGSVIVAINHQPVRSPQDLTQLVTRGPVGTPLPIHYVLPGGQSRQAEVVLQALEQPLERALVGETAPAPLAQAPALEPAPHAARRVQTTTHQTTDADPLARLEDVLRRVNGRLEQLERRLERLAPNR